MIERNIEKYIKYMVEKHGIIAAMITGSYVEGKMGPNSDIDIFFIWEDEERSMRGREYYLNVEFEYFISPEWKYYDRLKDDYIAMSIYSSGVIVYDAENKFEDIKRKAIDRITDFSWNLSESQKRDMKFFIETIQKDGIDLYDKEVYGDFLAFTSSHIKSLCDYICKINNSLPVYMKYGVTKVKEIDSHFGNLLEEYLKNSLDKRKKELWIELCNYVSEVIGEYNIDYYESVQ